MQAEISLTKSPVEDGNGGIYFMNEQEKILTLINDKDFIKNLISLDSDEDVVKLFASHDVSLSTQDVHSILEGVVKKLESSEELDENDLENVAGGVSAGDAIPALIDGIVNVVESLMDVDWKNVFRRRW